MGGFQLDCAFCDTVIRDATSERVKGRSRTHLEDEHRDELLAEFATTFRGKKCQNGCGYVYPVGVDEVAGYDCPDCGHDHFSSFVQQYLYWQIEE
ncbi:MULTISPECIES: hypothetical protein [Halorussus]|uniref:hypothetical protein n=1 Tax=Halorussus TaxID=1070314 RepID=UPI00209FA357|nr:hypothetical protein [Halorussus vallis]USZ77019.1 hypothetical protein NGM07_06740 [Halorussus vallis]